MREKCRTIKTRFGLNTFPEGPSVYVPLVVKAMGTRESSDLTNYIIAVAMDYLTLYLVFVGNYFIMEFLIGDQW